MKRIEYDKKKNVKLKIDRGINFDEITNIIESQGLFRIVEHPNKTKYPNQKLFLVPIRNYIYVVPFVEDDKKIFLKTIFASRKHTKKINK